MEEDYTFRPRNTLSLKETIQMSPIEKHIYHSTLLILVTVQVSLIFNKEVALHRAQNRLLENTLLVRKFCFVIGGMAK
jgi:cell division protein FtsL